MDFLRKEGDVNFSQERRQWQQNTITDETAAILAEDEKYFIHQSLSTPCLTVLESAEGSYLTDVQGNRYLDFHGNSAHQVGHQNKKIIDAIIDELKTLPFSPRRFTNKKAIALAARLIELTNGALSRVLFTTAGTTAVSTALKMVRRTSKKHKIISLLDSFHGASIDAISVGGEEQFRKDIGPLLPGVIHLPSTEFFFQQYDTADAVQLFTELFEETVEREGDIAAFILEPIRCTTVTIPPVELWKTIRQICTKYGIYIIFDEIPLAFGRTGKMFTYQHYAMEPDLLCLGKGLGGGVFPLAAVLAKEEFNNAQDVALGHYTHEKSPVGAAAALAMLDIISQEGFLASVEEKGFWLAEKLRQMQQQYPFIKEVRQIGLLLGVEMQSIPSLPFSADAIAEKIMYASLAGGLSFKVSGGNVLTLTPPLTVSYEELTASLEILYTAFTTVQGA